MEFYISNGPNLWCTDAISTRLLRGSNFPARKNRLIIMQQHTLHDVATGNRHMLSLVLARWRLIWNPLEHYPTPNDRKTWPPNVEKKNYSTLSVLFHVSRYITHCVYSPPCLSFPIVTQSSQNSQFLGLVLMIAMNPPPTCPPLGS